MAEATDQTNGKAPGAKAAPEQKPVLYVSPQLINSERHAKAGVAEIADFGFARPAAALPLGADELFVAQAHYPIVFTGSEPPVPVVVLGIGRNLYVDAQGKWRPGNYLPAYIRRYPFILARDATGGGGYLAVDEAASCFSMSGGRPLFEGDKPSALSRQALEFSLAFETQLTISRNFGEALRAAGILAMRRADLRHTDGTRLSLDGFRVIDEALFEAVPNETFLQWRRNGWLGLVYAHLLSMRKWQEMPFPAAGA